MAEKINFTKAAIEGLPIPSNGRQEYVDTRLAGLRLRVTSTGTKTFCVFKRLRGGGMERVTLARYPDMTIEQARKKAAEVLGKIAEGNSPAEVRRSLKAEPTFAELFVTYGERHGKKKRSWGDDQQRYRDYLEKPLGKVKVGAITTAMIARIFSEMERSGKANATINAVRAVASVIFSRGAEPGVVLENPVRPIKRLKTVSRDRFLRSHELPRFFVSLANEPNVVIRDYLWISLLTGARRANVLAMRWSEINLAEGIWRIPITKNGDPQNVTLGAEVIATLTNLKDDADSRAVFVFPGSGKSGHLVEPKKGWLRIIDRDELTQLKTLIAAAGKRFDPLVDRKTRQIIPEALETELTRARARATEIKLNVEGARMLDLRIHDLRRTFGSWQAMTGASLSIIGKSLNHKNVATTAIYSRLDLDPVRASIERATSAMLAAGGMTNGNAPISSAP
jgi:integrase